MGQKKQKKSENRGAILAICFGLLWIHPNLTEAGEVTVSAANGGSTAVYDDTTLLVQIDSTREFIDHEKHGFFRLGLMPILVVEGIKIQILSANCLTNLASGFDSTGFSNANLRRLELRKIEVALLNEKTPRLKADVARINAGFFDLSNVTVSLPDAVQISIPKATLQITGLTSGQLRWRQDGMEKAVFIFQTQNPPKK